MKKILASVILAVTSISAFCENVEQMKESNVPIASISPNFIEIDTKAYTHNLHVVKQMIGDEVKLCVVMKSDAYGHGIVNLIDQTVSSPDVDCIAAVDNSEMEVIAPAVMKSGKDIAILRIAHV